ncbi:MAG TPA: hypothetical protein VJ908_05635 [Wenzhouxiangellaceae bacterium]|nr:hypothetical protein [Wenzhouxiangellaceae bacterium]
MSLFTELKRRNVFRVGLFYIVSAWLVVQVAETLLPVFDVSDAAIRIIVLILALGFPLALVFAWVFELTPDGLKRDKDIHVDPATKQQTAHKLNWATLVAAVLAIGLLIGDRLLPEPAATRAPPAAMNNADSLAPATMNPEPDPASIAVLPFADLSPEGDQQYFSDGIAEEILNVLVSVDGLAVASRTSSFQFKGMQTIGIPAIADQLEVRHVLEGSVRTAGETIRVTAQLIDAKTDQHLWSQSWDRELTTDNIFAIQDEIASAIVTSIRDNLGTDVGATAPVPQRTENVDAYSLFLRARALFQSRTFFAEAHDQVSRALALDPEFVDALALKAAILTVSPEYGVLLADSADASRKQARELAQRALGIDPQNALGLGIIGLIRDFEVVAGDRSIGYADILAAYEDALEFAPDDPALLNWRGFGYLRAGYLDRARFDFEHCLRVEPGYAPCNTNLIAALTLAGDTEAALKVLDESLRLGVYGGDIPTLINLHQLELEQAFYFVAIQLPSLRGWLGMEEIHAALSRPEEDHDLLIRRLKRHGDAAGSRASIDELLIALGEYHIPHSTYSFWFDAYRAYRASPEFKRHLRRLGLPEFWRANGFPPMCRPLGKEDFECD